MKTSTNPGFTALIQEACAVYPDRAKMHPIFCAIQLLAPEHYTGDDAFRLFFEDIAQCVGFAVIAGRGDVLYAPAVKVCAAAQDLLTACEEALFWFEQYAEDNTDKHCKGEMDVLRAAIVKAGGKLE